MAVCHRSEAPLAPIFLGRAARRRPASRTDQGGGRRGQASGDSASR
ncbi:MAG: hypothetical protein M0C28_37020 [Candidatus Moduliflexus flocculans]|nr:hypothetical protein [Candidatus Moduliflexus flocculans]